MAERLRISPHVLFRELEGEAVLLDLRSQRYFGLDAVGTRVWQLFAEHGSRDAVLEALLEEFDVGRQELQRDLDGLLARLAEAGLLLPEAAGSRDGDGAQGPG